MCVFPLVPVMRGASSGSCLSVRLNVGWHKPTTDRCAAGGRVLAAGGLRLPWCGLPAGGGVPPSGRAVHCVLLAIRGSGRTVCEVVAASCHSCTGGHFFELQALYCNSLHREAASGSKDDLPDCDSNSCSPGHLKDRRTRIKHAAKLLCTQTGSEPKSKQRMQACYDAFWRMLVDEEHKAQAKVFALGAKDQTLRKQAVGCTEGASKRQELEAEIRENQAALAEAIADRATLESELLTANHIRQEASSL
ncbi:hypothetical protein ABBQ38_003781 [Trebouxia sp. C0009 RCD-2024]